MPKENDGDIYAIEEVKDEYGNDVTDYKAYADKFKGLAKRYQGKYHKYKTLTQQKPKEPEKPAEEQKKETKSELDYGQKAFLIANGIKGKDEIELVKQYLAIGKDLDDIIESKHFQNDLKDLREEKASKEAIPSGSKRSSTSSRDSVDYWLAKGELPPADQVELRRKVVNAKIAAEKGKNVFTANPVVRS